ncbi:hypothetical protein COCON_G00211730 [Conger conger]|uniref:Small G protein signaling modulator 3 n=1 Tax=Conger conger TaxID=82655 RepID=A0A9Q1D0R3_CONCO|nr:hypothetical protein COCON_G00211730 [Conger conger]
MRGRQGLGDCCQCERQALQAEVPDRPSAAVLNIILQDQHGDPPPSFRTRVIPCVASLRSFPHHVRKLHSHPWGPFSALTPSMWPQDLLAKYYQKDSPDEPEPQYDEFGFRMDSEDGVELQEGGVREGAPQREDPQQRLRWQAHLEFTHNHTVGDLTWDLISPSLARSDRLRALVLAGIPHSMRPQLWMRLSGALQKKRGSEISYREEEQRRHHWLRSPTERLLRTAPTTTPLLPNR